MLQLEVRARAWPRESGPKHPGGPKPDEKVRRLQRKLYGAAKQQKGRRFHALYDRICRSDVLRRRGSG